MFSVQISVQNTLEFYEYLSHSVQTNKAAIKLDPRDLSFSIGIWEKQTQVMTKVSIDKKEKKAPPLMFDPPPFRLPY